MPNLDSPLQLSPVFLPKIWGREKLEPIFKRPASFPPGELIGEVWLTASESRFMNGPIAGMTLGEASEQFGPQLNGEMWKDRRFPLLAKYIYTSDWLSVQVHPDDAQAARFNPGERGKCELWYMVSSGRKGAYLAGVKPRVTAAKLRASFEQGTSRSDLNLFHPRPGEAVFMPPGTVHALGPGLVLFEVEENSDLTYRLDDFGRKGLDGKPRPLHLEKGLAVARLDAPALRNLPVVSLKEPWGSHRFVTACGYFALEELNLQKRAVFRGRGHAVEVLSVLAGEGRIETPAGWLGFHCGDTWLIPPAAAEFRLVPREKTQLLKFYVPDVDKDFRRPLLKRGVQTSTIERIIFAE
ncbi:MAG: class I mannose-6-phosphate isomerase [Acidobacteria bacterium]|nr:class I mannose-6-phosphate isomerase [Acidobacteriota bacterium]